MKYVITGSAGNISKPLALQLLNAGHHVTVVGRKVENLLELTNAGAIAAIGSIEDVDFLTTVFTGADAVYTMVPPNFGATDWKSYIANIGGNYAVAIKNAGVKYVVNLSSMGAHMPTGCGPVSGLHFAEKHLDALDGVNVKHLRPAFFYPNHFASIPMIKNMGIIGGNYGENTILQMAAIEDIASAAAEELAQLNFTGKSVHYIVSDEKTTKEIAAILGQAIGKPELPWINIPDEQMMGGMIQAGLPEEIAKNYVEMGVAIRTGSMKEELEKNRATLKGGTTDFESFASVFAIVYNS